MLLMFYELLGIWSYKNNTNLIQKEGVLLGGTSYNLDFFMCLPLKAQLGPTAATVPQLPTAADLK